MVTRKMQETLQSYLHVVEKRTYVRIIGRCLDENESKGRKGRYDRFGSEEVYCEREDTGYVEVRGPYNHDGGGNMVVEDIDDPNILEWDEVIRVAWVKAKTDLVMDIESKYLNKKPGKLNRYENLPEKMITIYEKEWDELKKNHGVE